jgi:hypothetical protein
MILPHGLPWTSGGTPVIYVTSAKNGITAVMMSVAADSLRRIKA